MANGAPANIQLTTRQALEFVRNSEGDAPASAFAALERAIAELWARIQANPNTYVMNANEFAVFNYYRSRYTTSDVARDAVARFWNNFQGNASDIDGWTG